MNDKYILGENHEIIATDLITWGRWLQEGDTDKRRVARDVIDGYFISTVFLGLDHRFGDDGPPLLFETMIFPNERDLCELYCDRYSTWEEAIAGHAAAIEKIRTGEVARNPPEEAANG